MNDSISRQAVEDLIMETDPFWCEGMTRAIFEGVKRLPTIYAVPVVRCKDCKYYRKGKVLSPQKFCFRLRGRGGEEIGYNFADDDFCSYGERSEE